MSIMSMNELIVIGMVFLSELIGTIVVFGSSAFFLPIAVNLIGKNASLGLMSFFQVISNTLKFGVFFRKINWNVVLWFGLPSLVMVGIGSYFTKQIDITLFKRLLGIVLMLLVVFEILHKYELPKNKFTEVIGGITSGFISGLIGTGGTIRGYFIFSFNLPKEMMIATYCIIDYSGDFLRFLIYLQNGLLDARVWYLAPYAVLATILANVIGIWSLKFIPVELFKSMVMLILLVLSLLMLLGL
jgi:uncharacterized protein